MKKVIIFALSISLLLNAIFVIIYFYGFYVKKNAYPKGIYCLSDNDFFESNNFDTHPIMYNVELEAAELSGFAQNFIYRIYYNDGEIPDEIIKYVAMSEQSLERMQSIIKSRISHYNRNKEKTFIVTILGVKTHSDKAVIDFGTTMWLRADTKRAIRKNPNLFRPDKMLLEKQNDNWVVVNFFEAP